MKSVRPSPAAQIDIEEIVAYYARGSLTLGNLFIADYQKAVRAIAEMPGRGSPRFGQQLGVAGLRVYLLSQFPYLIFYREHSDAIDIDRILHAHRDVFGVFLGLESGL